MLVPALGLSSRWFARPLILAGAMVLVLFAATGFLGLQYWHERQAANLSLERSRQVLDTLDRLRTIIANLEAERRGYLLTLDPEYLKAYGVSDESVRRQARALQALVANDPLQNLRAGHLALTLSAKLRETDDIIKTARPSGLAALAMIRSMDEIRSQIDQMVDHERFLLVDGETRAEALEQRKTWLIAAAVVIVTVLAGAALALARLEARRRRKATEANVRLQSDLEEREKKIRHLVDANIIGIIISDLEGQIIEANDAFLSMVGYSREDLISGRILWTELTPPEWHAVSKQAVAQLRAIGSCKPFEKEYFRNDGSRVPVLIGAAAFGATRQESVAFVLDLTDRKHAEEAAQRSEKELRAVVETVPAMVWTALADGHVDFINRRWQEFTGMSLDETLGWKWKAEAPVHPDDVEQYMGKWNASLATGQSFEAEMRIRRAADGEYRWLFESAVPLRDEQGNILKWYGFVVDIEDRKRGEEALQKAQAELAHVNRVATMGQLTASIAHEVNQPIAATIVNAQVALRWLARRPPNLEEVREALNDIIRDGNRAGDVIARIRALIKKAPARKDSLDINKAIHELIVLTHGEAVKNGVSVHTQLASGLPSVQGDRVQLQQVILNLIMNAIEAMSGASEGTRELRISSAEPESGGVVVAVCDSGPGLAPEAFDRLFEAFHTTKSTGMGMGLSICRAIIEAHGGRIWASVNEPRGAVFQFTLPPIQDETVPAEHTAQRLVV
jgi:PAS domain S-box-containing protein